MGDAPQTVCKSISKDAMFNKIRQVVIEHLLDMGIPIVSNLTSFDQEKLELNRGHLRVSPNENQQIELVTSQETDPLYWGIKSFVVGATLFPKLNNHIKSISRIGKIYYCSFVHFYEFHTTVFMRIFLYHEKKKIHLLTQNLIGNKRLL